MPPMQVCGPKKHAADWESSTLLLSANVCGIVTSANLRGHRHKGLHMEETLDCCVVDHYIILQYNLMGIEKKFVMSSIFTERKVL